MFIFNIKSWKHEYWVVFFQAEDGIRDLVRSRGLGDVYKRQALVCICIFLTEDFYLCMNIPSGSVLKQNIPNPARGNTVIKYNLFENTSEVSLKLYDANGSEVMNLTQGSQQIGEHDIKVDVSKLSSGSYLYQLKISTSIGDQVYAKTMQVVK